MKIYGESKRRETFNEYANTYCGKSGNEGFAKNTGNIRIRAEFYEGDGEAFRPFSDASNKYIKVKEED